MKTIPVLSLGMGVESVAILLRWIEEPAIRDFDLSELIVISAQTGDEYEDTRRDMETHVLPLMREHGIRYVQVARAGHLEEDGITVLDDTRAPMHCFTEGDYTLSDELMEAGTVPQFGGEHRCSLKFKAFVIETWLETNVYEPIRHAFGYNAEEPKRIAKSETAIKARVAFGFNSEEPKRIAKGQNFDHPLRIGWYPLPEWGWNREACEEYIFSVLGIRWKKSACVYCPFAKLTPAMKARHLEHPAQVAHSLLVEHLSLSMNFRGTLFASRSLREITEQAGNTEALGAFELKLATLPWAIYKVRRIYTAKGSAYREVKRQETGSRADMLARLAGKLMEPGTVRRDHHGITYAYQHEREVDVYPARESFFVAAPALVQDKSRYGDEWFERRWNQPAGEPQEVLAFTQ